MTQTEKAEYSYDKVPTKELIAEKDDVPPKYGYGVRHVQLLIGFITLTIVFIARAHLGVTVVAMTSHDTENISVLNTSIAHNVSSQYTGNSTTNGAFNATQQMLKFGNITNITNTSIPSNEPKSYFGTFKWTKSIHEMVLGAFFIGYCVMAFPIGMAVQKWGWKLPLQAALLINAIISISTPWLAVWGSWKAVCVCRIIQGLSQAGSFPCVQNLMANWAPISERASFSSYVYTGTTIGTVIGYQVAGFLADSSWGWPSIWWATGALCLACLVLLTIFGEPTPSTHKRITEEEKNYILGKTDDGAYRPRPRTPWKIILTSKPVWGILATHIGSGLVFVFCFTQAPSYVHYILGVDVKNSGLLSSLPYIASVFTSIAFGIISDFATKRQIVSVRNARRISNSISQVGAGVSLLLVTFTNSTALAIFFLITAMGCHMGINTGWIVNHIDLAPNYSGAMMATGNAFMNVFTVCLPLLVSQIVTDVRNTTQWRIMFFIVAGVAVFCNTVFVLLMSTDTQAWNDIELYDLTQEEARLEEKNEKSEKD